MSHSASTSAPDPETLARFEFLARVVHRTADHLRTTSTRLFTEPMSPARIAAMANDDDLADALNAAHRNVAMLTGVADRLTAELRRRGWA